MQWSYPTHCARRPYIHIGNFWPGEFRAFMSFIKPSYKQVLKTVLGFTEPCGVKLIMRDVDELQVFGNPDTATAILELPELAGKALFWWWIADVGFEAIKNFVSVAHIYHYCQPTAYFGTAQVTNTSFIMSGVNDQFSPTTMVEIVEDPGNWVQLGGTNIHPPIRGLYRVMAVCPVFANFGECDFTAAIQMRDNRTTQYYFEQSVHLLPGESRTLILGGVLNPVNDDFEINLATWNHGPAFGCWVMTGAKLIVSSE